LEGFVVLAEATKLGGTLRPADVNNGLAWFVFAIFNTYMMLWALRVNVAVFGVFLTLEITGILLTIGLLLQGCPRGCPPGSSTPVAGPGS
jgi:succinate-acetate transporter protein